MMSDEEVKERKIWQEKVYKSLLSVKDKKEVEIFGKVFTVLPGMFAPLWGDSLLLAKQVKKEVKNNDRVLDLGAGTGIQGIFAAEKTKSVLSVDINPRATQCTLINVKRHNLQNVTVKISNLFSKVENRFDLIIFNPPFRWFLPRDIMERSSTDRNYKTLIKFFSEARGYLSKNGRILLVFSDSGDLNFLKKLIKENKFNKQILAKENINSWNYFVYRLTL